MAIPIPPAKAGHTEKDPQNTRPLSPRGLSARVALGAGTVLILSFLLSIHLIPDRVSLQVGDTSPSEIRAHKTVRYDDSVATERLRAQAAERVDKLYTAVPTASSDAVLAASNAFEVIRRARNDNSLDRPSEKTAYVKRNLRIEFSPEALAVLVSVDSATFDSIEEYGKKLIKELMSREIRDDTDDVQVARAELRRRLSNYLGSTRYANAAAEIGDSVIRPNRLYDQEATDEARRREIRAVPEQYRHIFIGDVVIHRNERVTKEHLDKFMALGLQHPQIDYVTVLCIAALVAGVVIFVIAYLARYHPQVFASTKLLLLLSIIVVLSVLGLKLGGVILGLSLSGLQFGYFAMIWISTAGMLTAVLLSPQIALLVVALLSTTSSLAMNHELRWALASLVSSLVAIYVVSDIRHRSDLVRVALAVCTANLAMVWLIGRISGDAMSDLFVGSGWAVAGGLGSVTLFWLGTAALERPFGVTTHIRLLELTDTNNPILRRLLMEAPGTYSHSIFVASIAAAAAEAIGADPLVVRAAAYYHDVGKMKRPHYYVENQYVENIHDRLNPSLSAAVIKSHTKDGLELAREYNLPPLIRDMIIQHHGTSVIRYFYNQAINDAAGQSPADETLYRYDGQKPQSAEAALLMLADSVEAASRSLSNPTPEEIEAMIDRIIMDKLSDGQLDECALTFTGISKIKESFLRSLKSILHSRIEYPEPQTTEASKVGGNGSASEKLPAPVGEPQEAEKSG